MDDDVEKLEELLKSLDIDRKHVYHIILSNNIELIAELLPFNKKTKVFTAINPLKALKESYMDDDMLMSIDILTVFDPNMDTPVLEINRDQIITMYRIDEDKLERYVYTLYDYYFPVSIELDEDIFTEKVKKSKSKANKKSNIVSFIDYKEKRIKGLF